MKRSTAKCLIILDMILMLIFMAIFRKSETTVVLVGLAAMVIAAVLSHFLRCPSCGRGQGRDWMFTQYCPHCGEPLDDE